MVEDVTKCLELPKSKAFVLKCLIDIQQLFSNTEPFHIHNDLYITDYCVWVQSLGDNELRNLGQALAGVAISKDSLQLNLAEVEQQYLRDADTTDSDDNDAQPSSSDENSYCEGGDGTARSSDGIDSMLQQLHLTEAEHTNSKRKLIEEL